MGAYNVPILQRRSLRWCFITNRGEINFLCMGTGTSKSGIDSLLNSLDCIALLAFAHIGSNRMNGNKSMLYDYFTEELPRPTNSTTSISYLKFEVLPHRSSDRGS